MGKHMVDFIAGTINDKRELVTAMEEQHMKCGC